MPAILTQTERNDELSVLLKSGWEMVENRDAIYKKFKFKSLLDEYSNIWKWKNG